MVWHNIDFLEETLTGAGMTHMVNGIIIQSKKIKEHDDLHQEFQHVPVKKSIRSLKAPQKDIRPYVLGKRESGAGE